MRGAPALRLGGPVPRQLHHGTPDNVLHLQEHLASDSSGATSPTSCTCRVRSTSSSTSPPPRHPSTTSSCRSTRSRWARSARGTRSAWRRTRAPDSCSHPRRRSTATQVHPQPESYWDVNPIGPRGVYDEGKRYGEALTTAYRSSEGVDTGIVRIFNTYGPRMRPHDGRAIPTFIRQALRDEPITFAGDGLQTRSSATWPTSSRGSSPSPTARIPVGQPRQPGRDDRPTDRRGHRRGGGLAVGDRQHRPSRRRPAGPPPRHGPGRGAAVAAARAVGEGARADGRVVPRRGHRRGRATPESLVG